MKCKRCGSEANNQEVMPPSGPHYGKLVCASCGNFLQWLPWPRKPIDPAKMPSHPQGAPLPALKGASDKQVLFGEKCRAEMLLRVTSLEQSLWSAIQTIDDATWWIANRDKSVASIHWPHTWS